MLEFVFIIRNEKPAEFWFLFGLMIGPAYEYWKGEKLKAKY